MLPSPGALLVDKPSGPTSHDVVARARRALGERSIGHTGTLDPMATGLLVLLCGRATRLATFMAGAIKTYEASVRLGIVTDTYDAAGTVQPAAGVLPADLDAAAIGAAMEAVRHQAEQLPPAYSAKQVGGVRAYTLARKNQTPDLKPVAVRVHDLAWSRPEAELLSVTLTCSAGYYVRAMAHEIGQRLGCGAHLERLRRTRVASFDVANAVPLDVLERAGTDGNAGWLMPMEALLPEMPAVRVTEAGERRTRHGNVLGSAHVAQWLDDRDASGLQPVPALRYRVLGRDNALLAIAQATPAGLQPTVVVAPQH